MGRAAIFHAGLSKLKRHDEAKKAIQNAIGLSSRKKYDMAKSCYYYFCMLGFTGAVVGMIAAFDAIKAANDISPAVVAGGILNTRTTAFSLIVAMIIQTFQNVFVARIDN